jgi:RND family efflux transporter MFP subunit
MLAGCGKQPTAAAEAKPVEVVVTTPIRDEVRDFEDFTGRLDALKTVDIRARATGYVQQVPFKEGDQVKEGDLLFQINPEPYQADLDQAEANLKLAQADVRLQQRLIDRARQLLSTSSISREDYDQNVGALEKAQATVGSMTAARDRAKLYLSYTRVVAPISGRVSRRFVDPGNLVKADDTMLTTIVTEDPLYAYFDVNERTYLDLVGAVASEGSSSVSEPQTPSPGAAETGAKQPTTERHGLPADRKLIEGNALPVLMRLANEEEFTRLGRVDFIDNRIIGTMGTVRMRGVFDNHNQLLKPGLFVRIRLPIGAPYKALLISDEALMSDQGRKYVFVVNDKNVAIYRPVVLGQGIHGLRVIKEGLSAGDRVIVSGMQRVRQDMSVQVKMQDPPKPPASPLGRVLRQEEDGKRTHQASKS